MDQLEIIEHWRDSAKRNAKLADDLLNLDHRSWTLFIRHLSIEKALKAIILSKNAEVPYSHDLVKLATFSEIDVSDEIMNQLEEITT